MKIILPMAGRGSRFEGSEFATPKPFILVEGKPMFAIALSSLLDLEITQLVIIALKEHVLQFDILNFIPKKWKAITTIIAIPEVTEGQLCTVLEAKEHINLDEDILIVSSDTIVITELANEIKSIDKDCRGLISVAKMEGDRYSFARTDENGNVVEVAEKIRISEHASTGLYYFRSGKEMCEYALKIVSNKETTKGEYYVIPVYQKYIDNKQKIGISKASAMHDLGTPDSLKTYLATLE